MTFQNKILLQTLTYYENLAVNSLIRCQTHSVCELSERLNKHFQTRTFSVGSTICLDTNDLKDLNELIWKYKSNHCVHKSIPNHFENKSLLFQIKSQIRFEDLKFKSNHKSDLICTHVCYQITIIFLFLFERHYLHYHSNFRFLDHGNVIPHQSMKIFLK